MEREAEPRPDCWVVTCGSLIYHLSSFIPISTDKHLDLHSPPPSCVPSSYYGATYDSSLSDTLLSSDLPIFLMSILT